MQEEKLFDTHSSQRSSGSSSSCSLHTDKSLERADDDEDFKDGYYIKKMVQKVQKLEINTVSSHTDDKNDDEDPLIRSNIVVVQQ